MLHNKAQISVDGKIQEWKQFRLYRGTVLEEMEYGEENIGWVALRFLEEDGKASEGITTFYEGYFTANQDSYILEFSQGQVAAKKRILREARDEKLPTICGFNPLIHAQSMSEITRLRKRELRDGCPASRKMVYIGVATDCTYFSKQNSVESTINSIMDIMNKVSALFERTFNVSIGLIDVQVNTMCNTANGMGWNRECSTEYNLNDRLSDFSKWRGLTRSSEAGLWHLVMICIMLSSPLVVHYRR